MDNTLEQIVADARLEQDASITVGRAVTAAQLPPSSSTLRRKLDTLRKIAPPEDVLLAEQHIAKVEHLEGQQFRVDKERAERAAIDMATAEALAALVRTRREHIDREEAQQLAAVDAQQRQADGPPPAKEYETDAGTVARLTVHSHRLLRELRSVQVAAMDLDILKSERDPDAVLAVAREWMRSPDVAVARRMVRLADQRLTALALREKSPAGPAHVAQATFAVQEAPAWRKAQAATSPEGQRAVLQARFGQQRALATVGSAVQILGLAAAFDQASQR